jgi:hypothetical protein
MLNGHNLPPGKELPVIEKDKYIEEMEEDLKKLDEEEERPILNLISNYVMKKRLGELFNFTSSHEIETNNDTVNLISQIVYDKFKFVQKQMRRKYKQGFELGIDPCLLGSKKNIQFIKGEENRKKWDSYQPIEVVKSIIGDSNGL